MDRYVKKMALSLVAIFILLLAGGMTLVFSQAFPSMPGRSFPPAPASPPAYTPIPPQPLPPPATAGPSALEKEKGTLNPRTGEFYPGTIGGVIDPRTGVVLPKVGGGYLNPQTGETIPQTPPDPK
jgi:hypothetical protein